ncbi:hypothetical protein [Nocardia sp. NPDC059239]|uniref:hypothetical protein n=1 Tax=Nocardia sp. NPDC059239 TaxID=3346785 RepID=UPI0036A3C607
MAGREAQGRTTRGKNAGGRVGRKSLGDRSETKLRWPEEIDLQQLAREHGYASANQFLSDWICLKANRPELASPKASQQILDLGDLAVVS